jgi:hypothetical protein
MPNLTFFNVTIFSHHSEMVGEYLHFIFFPSPNYTGESCKITYGSDLVVKSQVMKRAFTLVLVSHIDIHMRTVSHLGRLQSYEVALALS